MNYENQKTNEPDLMNKDIKGNQLDKFETTASHNMRLAFAAFWFCFFFFSIKQMLTFQ